VVGSEERNGLGKEDFRDHDHGNGCHCLTFYKAGIFESSVEDFMTFWVCFFYLSLSFSRNDLEMNQDSIVLSIYFGRVCGCSERTKILLLLIFSSWISIEKGLFTPGG